jgi:hypothetical protein
VNQFDLRGEYGRSAIDVRHSLFLGGSIIAPWRVRFSPFVTANSGRPFNITTGRDTNLDTLFTERPAFADSLTPTCPPNVNPLSCDLRRTAWGNFDINPKLGQTIIPRNFGAGPGFFTLNLRLNRTFGFGRKESARSTPTGGQRGGQRGGGNRGRVAGSRTGARDTGGEEKRYNLTFSLNAINVVNHNNRGQFIANLSSPLFGQPVATAGGFGGEGRIAGSRRVELQVRLEF